MDESIEQSDETDDEIEQGLIQKILDVAQECSPNNWQDAADYMSAEPLAHDDDTVAIFEAIARDRVLLTAMIRRAMEIGTMAEIRATPDAKTGREKIQSALADYGGRNFKIAMSVIGPRGDTTKIGGDDEGRGLFDYRRGLLIVLTALTMLPTDEQAAAIEVCLDTMMPNWRTAYDDAESQ